MITHRTLTSEPLAVEYAIVSRMASSTIKVEPFNLPRMRMISTIFTEETLVRLSATDTGTLKKPATELCSF